MKLRKLNLIRQIRNFFCIMSLASRRLEEYSQEVKSRYLTKGELIKSISKAIGTDWKNIAEIEIDANKIKIVRYYQGKK